MAADTALAAKETLGGGLGHDADEGGLQLTALPKPVSLPAASSDRRLPDGQVAHLREQERLVAEYSYTEPVQDRRKGVKGAEIVYEKSAENDMAWRNTQADILAIDSRYKFLERNDQGQIITPKSQWIAAYQQACRENGEMRAELGSMSLSPVDGINWHMTQRQLDLHMGRKERLVQEGKWISNDEYEALVEEKRTERFAAAGKGIEEYLAELEQSDPEKAKELRAKMNELDPGSLYRAIAVPEENGNMNRFRRTTVPGAYNSSAFGPGQITKSLFETVLSRGDIPHELVGFTRALIAQGNQFLATKNSGGTYGLGGPGDVVRTEEDAAKYHQVAEAVVKSELGQVVKNNPNLSAEQTRLKFAERWRGLSYNQEPHYFQSFERAYGRIQYEDVTGS